MNIFFVDSDPILAARALVDQHCNKMVTETAQVLSNCYTIDRMAEDDCPRTKTTQKPRKHSYPHHPCCKWIQRSINNFWWLIRHGNELENERHYRGYTEPHYSHLFIQWCEENPPDLPQIEMTVPEQAFGDHNYLKQKNPVDGYRAYYNIAKREQKTLRKVWTKRGAPDWWL